MINFDRARRATRLVVAFIQRSRRTGYSVANFTQSKRGLLVLLVLAVAAAVGVWSLVHFWDWLQTVSDDKESGSTTIRNIGLVIAGVIALPLALWRSWVAHRQADTADQNLLNERYQQGAQMLGSDVLAVRLGGIYALQRLANDYPEHYHIETMKLFCAFVRNPTGDVGVPSVTNSRGRDPLEEIEGPKLREDVQSIMNVIGSRSKMAIDLEENDGYTLNLRGASLVGALLQHANLSSADLDRADFKHAVLRNTDLSGARFGMFVPNPPINGLTQTQLDQACADPDNPPKLYGIVDDVTCERLVWRGEPLGDET